MESRQMLAVNVLPIEVGAVYLEDAGGQDTVGDLFHVTFQGGADGTQMTQLEINTDKDGDGVLDIGECIFDIDPAAPGAYGSVPFSIVETTGIDSWNVSVADGGMTLVMTFTGFDPGDKLVFSIDVDEQLFAGPSSIAEGAEFEYSDFSATFEAPHFYSVVGTDDFLDVFSDALSNSTLDLPPEDYNLMASNEEPLPLYTAGAIFEVVQEPLPIAISGSVFEDLDMDNQFDASEPGIGGVKLTLFELVDTQYVSTGRTEFTAGDGSYEFAEVSPGTYRVAETQPLDFLSVGAKAGTVDGTARGNVLDQDTITDITLLGGESSVTNNFGEIRPASISGHVYHDADNDGFFDSTETGIGGAMVTVERVTDEGTGGGLPDDDFPDDGGWGTWDTIGTEPRIVYTAADGSWSVEGLMPGEYRVTEVTPLGYYDGLDREGSAGGTAHNPGDKIDDITLAPNEAATDYDFGELLPGGISGYVYADDNNDGVFDNTELPIAGVTVALLDASGTPTGATIVTDSNGYYEFTNLVPGIYGVIETQPSGYYDGLDTAGSKGGTAQNPGDKITGATIGSGVFATDYNFGELRPGGISGYVYADDDNDGVFDSTELPIEGVTLALTNASGTPTGATVVTDSNGYYEFTNLAPGTYGVVETQPSGYLDGLDTAGSAGGTPQNPDGDQILGAMIGSNVFATDYNFGELRPGQIAGRVFIDYDGDDQLDYNERVLPGVTVQLFNEDGAKVGQTTTNNDGEYSFEGLAPGVYSVVEVQPTGYVDAADWAGTLGGTVSNDRISQIVIAPGSNGTGYDFTELELGTISGYVFQDGPIVTLGMEDPIPDPATIRDGVRNASDTPIKGVVMVLGDGSGVPILDGSSNPITSVTDSNGYYEFTGLMPGVYTVLQDHPDGYIDSIDTPGSAGGIAVNVKDNLSPATLSILAVDPKDDAIIQIVIQPGQEATAYNFSEIRIQREPFIPPPHKDPDPEVVERQLPPMSSPVPVPVPKYQPVHREVLASFSGGGPVIDNTWHLSIIDGGQPRRALDAIETATIEGANPYFNPVSWSGKKLDKSRWLIADDEGEINFETIFGMEASIPVTGDWDGDGHDQVGVFVAGYWFLDLNGNGVWDKSDLWIQLGDEGDQPVTGDWDGDGKTDIGIFGQTWKNDPRAILVEPGLPTAKNEPVGRFKNLPPDPEDAPETTRKLKRTAGGPIRSDLIDHVFRFGMAGDKAIAGDFNGDGIATIGIFRAGNWHLDLDGNGRWSAADQLIQFGQNGDIPVVGDFNGDGVDEIGIWRNGQWLIDSNGNHEIDAQDKVFELGEKGDTPVAGDFNGDGTDEPGVYRNTMPIQHAYHADSDTVTQ